MAGLIVRVAARISWQVPRTRLLAGILLAAYLAASDWSVMKGAAASRASADETPGVWSTDFEQWAYGEKNLPEYSGEILQRPDQWEDVYGLSRLSSWQRDNGSDSQTRKSQKGGKASWRVLGQLGGIRRKLIEQESTVQKKLEQAAEQENEGTLRQARKARHKRWTGNVERLLDRRAVSEREKAKREQGSLETEWLDTEIRRDAIIHTYLDYYKVVAGPKYRKENVAYTKCKGAACPDFAPCSERNFSAIEVCHMPGLMDTDQPIPRPPVNCPFLGTETVRGQEVGIVNRNCTHPIDFVRHELFLNQVFVLHNVYMNARGQIFNATHNFDRNGCGSEAPYVYPAGRTRVTVFERVVHLANWNAWAFYHGTIEMLPMFYLLANITQKMRGVPITHRVGQSVFLETVGQHILGLPVDSLNLHTIPNDELFFAKTVIQPYYQWCARPSRSLWLEFRKKYLVPRDGVPMFHPDWTLRKPQKEASEKDPIPEDWVVVLGKRFHTRGLAQSDEVEGYLKKIYPPERIAIFDGSLSILEAKQLFNRARLYVAVHGAAMTNMIFMPFKGFIYEIRPRAYHNSCYHYLAEVCSLEYFLSFGDGHKDSHTSVDVPEVLGVLDMIKERMDAQLVASTR